jgi:hypothetical protein
MRALFAVVALLLFSAQDALPGQYSVFGSLAKAGQEYKDAKESYDTAGARRELPEKVAAARRADLNSSTGIAASAEKARAYMDAVSTMSKSLHGPEIPIVGAGAAVLGGSIGNDNETGGKMRISDGGSFVEDMERQESGNFALKQKLADDYTESSLNKGYMAIANGGHALGDWMAGVGQTIGRAADAPTAAAPSGPAASITSRQSPVSAGPCPNGQSYNRERRLCEAAVGNTAEAEPDGEEDNVSEEPGKEDEEPKPGQWKLSATHETYSDGGTNDVPGEECQDMEATTAEELVESLKSDEVPAGCSLQVVENEKGRYTTRTTCPNYIGTFTARRKDDTHVDMTVIQTLDGRTVTSLMSYVYCGVPQ